MKTINCAECNVVYEYEPAKGYPDKRKYCANCSEKKKASWNEKKEEVPTASSSSETTTETTQESKNGYQKDYEKPASSLEYEIRSREVRCRALEAGVNFAGIGNITVGELITMTKQFEEWILSGK